MSLHYWYWLILLAGDVEMNPGPARFPCTVCGKSVRRNQHAVSCDRCEMWTHAEVWRYCEGKVPEATDPR